MNKVFLIGNIGSVEVKQVKDLTIADISLATTEFGKKDENGTPSKYAEWHSLVIFGALAEHAEKYLSKGDKIAVEGRLRTQTYEDKDGITRYRTQIIVNTMEFFNSKKGKKENE